MKNLKKIVALILSLYLLFVAVACSNDDTEDGGGDDTVTVKTISSTILDGKIANLMGADGIGIADKTEKQAKSSAVNPFMAVAHADSTESTQKKNEFVKSTDDGFLDVCFHETDGGNKSYKDLNNKFEKHHHNSVECTITDCAEISDEILAEENSGEVDTVLSLDARVNKLYTVGNFTFMAVSSAVEGSVRVMTDKSIQEESFSVMGGYPTFVNTEDNYDQGFTFSYIQINSGEKSGMIPVKVKESEENYHMINYWSDDFNQSFIIDNSTGITYSLSEFKYIYSVKGGLIKVCDQASINGGKFDYYKPVVTEGGIDFVKIEIPQGFSGQTHIDIYGNIIFESNKETQAQNLNPTIETKVGEQSILSTKNQECITYLENRYGKNTDKTREYIDSKPYHVGSDGRIYKVNFLDDMTNVSVKVLNENCEWQEVESTTDVEFYLGYISTRIGRNKNARWNAFSITAIKNGDAYYSTAAHSDNFAVWERALMIDDGFNGVVKMPVNGFSDGEENTVKEFAESFQALEHDYSVALVGSKQMLYITEDKVVLKDVETGLEKAIDVVVPNKGSSSDASGSLKIEGLGFIRLEKEIDLNTFGRNSFSSTPIEREVVLDGYYKLITSKK